MEGQVSAWSCRTTVSQSWLGSVWRYQPSTQGVGPEPGSSEQAPGSRPTQPARTPATRTAAIHTRIRASTRGLRLGACGKGRAHPRGLGRPPVETRKATVLGGGALGASAAL